MDYDIKNANFFSPYLRQGTTESHFYSQAIFSSLMR